MLGKLSWAAIPFHEPLPLISSAVVFIVILAVLALVTVKGWWPYLWREWLTSVDHKRLGVMYVLLGLVMLLRGFADAIMMRTQQAIAVGDAQGYLPPDHYDQIFSAHGTIMIFFVAMPLVIGLMNFAVPLQLKHAKPSELNEAFFSKPMDRRRGGVRQEHRYRPWQQRRALPRGSMAGGVLMRWLHSGSARYG
jgi:lysylphosphatidylglycerol synthetase-like protein (DUF2156 family)